jgi:hypothetical protein
MLSRHPESCMAGVRPLGGTQHKAVRCEGGARAQGWGGMVKWLRHPNGRKRIEHARLG